MRLDAQAYGQRTLRVEVDQQHAAPVLGERGAQVDGGGGLAHPALLVADRDDARRAVAEQRFRIGEGRRAGPWAR